MLRVSEFTCLSRNRFDAEVNLLVSDITFNTESTLMFVRIKTSKTDPFRVGVTLRLAITNCPLCLVAAMRAYLAFRSTSPGPLFIFDNGGFPNQTLLWQLF